MQKIQYESTSKGLVVAVPVSVFQEHDCSWSRVQRSVAHSLFILQRLTEGDILVEGSVVIAKNEKQDVELLLLIYRVAEDLEEERFLSVIEVLNGLGFAFQFLGWLDTTRFETHPILISVFDQIWLAWVDTGEGPVYHVVAHNDNFSYSFYPLADRQMVDALTNDGLPHLCLVPIEN